MKKSIALAFSALLATAAGAQMVTDSVVMGSGYANQIWYSMADDEQGSSPKKNWDIAFEINSITSSILLNTATGNQAWVYGNGDTADWATVDTAGILSWNNLYNSITSWSEGAFNTTYDPGNPNDLGWGEYNMSTHVITGDSIYIIKLANGDYKKLWIQNLSSSTYNFKYADLDGSNEAQKSIAKSAFTGKNFGYFSFGTGNSVNREPNATDWDITFTQYTQVFYIPQPYPQTVTGVLGNKNTGIIKAYPVNDPMTEESYNPANFTDEINAIGYNWKAFDNNTMSYSIADSTVYFIKDANADVWKLVFTKFTSSTGTTVFAKKKLTGANGIFNAEAKSSFFTVYPNPSAGSVNIITSNINGDAVVTVSDLQGRKVFSKNISAGENLDVQPVTLDELSAGVYTVTITAGNISATEKLVINK
ncbi:MAG TPA: T9SS type A sorting domain-containing protein [Bacteroidia bacterium]|nr:T9SS type A sorting domain-containing protein [Bacteroidia bacterium]